MNLSLWLYFKLSSGGLSYAKYEMQAAKLDKAAVMENGGSFPTGTASSNQARSTCSTSAGIGDLLCSVTSRCTRDRRLLASFESFRVLVSLRTARRDVLVRFVREVARIQDVVDYRPMLAVVK